MIDKIDQNNDDTGIELKHSCPICSLSSSNNESNERKLIIIILLEIDRDGGISYLNQLKSHSTSSIISKLLESYTPTLKLATFLEQYSSIFNVQRRKKDFSPLQSRTNDRHTVSLKQRDIIDHICNICLNTVIHQDEFTDQNQVKKVKQQLETRLYYILIQRNEKIKRRVERKKIHKQSSSTEFNNNSNYSINKHASMNWLAHKLEKELYQYSRLLDKQIRPFGVLVGSNEWWHMIMPIFISFVKQISSSSYIIHLHNNDTEIELIDLYYDSNQATNQINAIDSQLQKTSTQTNLSNKNQIISSELYSILTKQIHVPKLNGIDYGMLLQKHESLRKLLQGRDLIQIIQSEQTNPNSLLFHHVEIFSNQTQTNNNENVDHVAINKKYTNQSQNWRIRLKTKKNDKKQQQHRSLLYVANDDIGLFSVTGSKIASSMANSLYYHTVNTSQYINKTKKDSQSVPQTICIDLTAGIGGNTIACAKVFHKVIAYDIDETRVHACRQNINERLKQNENKNYPSNVIVRCENALTALPELAQIYRQRIVSSLNFFNSNNVDVSIEVNNDHNDNNDNENSGTVKDNYNNNYQVSIAVILDPPWGGLNYRQNETNESIGLIGNDGESFVPIAKIVYFVSLCLAPTVLGMKLPLTFEVDIFMHQLHTIMNIDDDTNDKIKIVSIKKMKRQLFLILRLL